MNEIIKEPLSVYIIKHPQCQKGLELSKKIYSEINRDIENQSIIKSTIPVYYSDSEDHQENQLIIDYSKSDMVAIVIFVDSNIIMDMEYGWTDYLNNLFDIAKGNSSIRLFPIALNNKAMGASVLKDSINNLNFIRLYEHTDDEDEGCAYLLLTLRHELCRMLYNLEPIKDATIETDAAVTIFLSHSKADGIEIVDRIRDYINNDTAINDFFDKVDIPSGTDFSRIIEERIDKSSILLVIHTDSYVNSEWCIMEVLAGKEKDIPILTVDCLKKGETRSFPYMGNTKSVRVSIDDDNMERDVISAALEEVLNKQVYRTKNNKYVKNSSLDKTTCIRNNTPELFTLGLTNFSSIKEIIYPEPPIREYENSILSKQFENVALSTPIMMQAKIHGLNLSDIQIEISISESEGIKQQGITQNHCQAFVIDLTRYLLTFGATVAYGGNLLYQGDNYIKTLCSVVRNYGKYYPEFQKIKNYVPAYLANGITTDDQLDFENEIDFIMLPNSPNGRKEDDLQSMRNAISEESAACVFAGGKIDGYSGNCQGVLEEFFLSIKKKKAVYVVGMFGGISQKIVDALTGKDQFFSTGDYIENIIKNKGSKCADENDIHKEIIEMMNTITMADLHNGLSNEDNLVLMRTTSSSEAIALILRGLRQITS